MQTAQLEALKKAIVNNLVPGDIPPGLYPFDNTVELRVRGACKRGANGMVKPTAKLPLLEILALVVAKAGIMGPHILELIREAAAEADKQGGAVGDYLETTKKAVKQVGDELVSKLPLMERAGSFSGAVDVEIVKIV